MFLPHFDLMCDQKDCTVKLAGGWSKAETRAQAKGLGWVRTWTVGSLLRGSPTWTCPEHGRGRDGGLSSAEMPFNVNDPTPDRSDWTERPRHQSRG